MPFENALGNQVWETWVWKLSVSHSISKCIFKWQNRVFWIVRNENSLKHCLTNKIVWGIWLFFLKIPTPLFQTLHIQILDALSSLPILLFLLLFNRSLFIKTLPSLPNMIHSLYYSIIRKKKRWARERESEREREKMTNTSMASLRSFSVRFMVALLRYVTIFAIFSVNLSL